jgi:Rod binding domain-containing protein
MTTPIGSPTSPPSPSELSAASAVAPAQKSGAPTRAQLVEAARQFDAVFVRIVLSSLEKTTKMGGSSGLSAGQSTYGSMVVDTVSDAVTRAGGTGLADKLIEALGPHLAPPAAAGTPAVATPAGATPTAAATPAGATPAAHTGPVAGAAGLPKTLLPGGKGP